MMREMNGVCFLFSETGTETGESATRGSRRLHTHSTHWRS